MTNFKMANELFYDEEVDYFADEIYEDIDYDSDIEAPEEDLREFSQFENHEVDQALFEGIDFDENIFTLGPYYSMHFVSAGCLICRRKVSV